MFYSEKVEIESTGNSNLVSSHKNNSIQPNYFPVGVMLCQTFC